MKHPWQITALLLSLFLVAQVVGIALVYMSIETITDTYTVEHSTTVIGDRPDLEGGESFLFIIVGVLLGTAVLLGLIKLRAYRLWKVWFFLAVWLALSVAFGVFIPGYVALGIAAVLAAWKIFKPGAIIHNFTEVFIYGGIAVLIAPLFTLFWMSLLLVAISIYDMIAVWKSKHMVTLAESQRKANLFAGLYLPKKEPGKPVKTGKKAMAVLGGGDIAFPLLFAGVLLTWIVQQSVPIEKALMLTFTVPVFTTAALTALFFYAKKDRYYPAMPFISAGCFAALGIVTILI